MPFTPPPNAIWVVDGHAWVFRAYYAIRSLSNSKGQATNAVFGFHQILRRLTEDFHPQYLAVAFDSPGPTFRDAFYPEYKANREAAPEDFRTQVPLVRRLVEGFRIPILEEPSYEADDLMATLAAKCTALGHPLIIVSSDKDLCQVVNPLVTLCRARPEDKQVEWVDEARTIERMGVPPARIVEYQALIGDSTDNIPGIPGIGPKSAVALLTQFASLEELLSNPDKIENKRWRTLVTEHAESARLSARLARLALDAPVHAELPEGLRAQEPDKEALAALYRELEFDTLLKALDATAVEASAPPERTTDYRALTTAAEVEAYVARVRTAGHVAFDTETTGTDPMSADIVGVSLCCAANEAVYIPIGHAGMGEVSPQVALEDVRRILGPLFADPKVTKVAHHAKYDIAILRRAGIETVGLTRDTMLQAAVLDPDRASAGLKQLARAELNIEMTPIADLIGTGKNQLPFSEVLVDRAAPYACADADMTLQLESAFEPKVKADGLLDLLERIEMPLIPVLVRMEEHGVAVDKAYLAELSGQFGVRLEELRRQIVADAGQDFNLNSPKQVGEILFEKLGLPTGKKTKTGYSTDVSVLETLADKHPVPRHMLQYRMFDKLRSTYVDQLPQLVNKRTGRIHASFHQIGAATGRISCSDPNLQNIPIRSEEGRQIRRAFVPSARDRVLIGADYSQVELRVLAHMSGDAALKAAFTAGDDVHRTTAAKIFGVPVAEISRQQRDVAKTINFGIVYGMGAFRLANDLEIEQKTAKKFIEDYFATYPGVAAFMEATKESAREKGYVTTLCGRRRHIADLDARIATQRQAAERVAINTPIQGTAADLIKLAMIALDRRLMKELPDCRMILQVHDELVFDCPRSQAEAAAVIVRETMEGALTLDVPLLVEARIGENWADCK